MVAHAQPLQKERWKQSVHLAVAQCNNPLAHVAHQLHKARVTLRVVNRKQASNRLPPPGEGVSVFLHLSGIHGELPFVNGYRRPHSTHNHNGATLFANKHGGRHVRRRAL